MYFTFCSFKMRPINAPPSTLAIRGFLLSECQRGIFPYFLPSRQREGHITSPDRNCRACVSLHARGSSAQRCVVTPTCWHISSTGHIEQYGKRPVQICFPKGTSKRLISIQYEGGRTASSATVVFSGVGVCTYPQRLVTR